MKWVRPTAPFDTPRKLQPNKAEIKRSARSLLERLLSEKAWLTYEQGYMAGHEVGWEHGVYDARQVHDQNQRLLSRLTDLEERTGIRQQFGGAISIDFDKFLDALGESQEETLRGIILARALSKVA